MARSTRPRPAHQRRRARRDIRGSWRTPRTARTCSHDRCRSLNAHRSSSSSPSSRCAVSRVPSVDAAHRPSLASHSFARRGSRCVHGAHVRSLRAASCDCCGLALCQAPLADLLQPARRVLYARPCLYRGLDGDTRFEALALTLKAQPTLAELVDELHLTSVYTCPSPGYLYAVQQVRRSWTVNADLQTVALAVNLSRVTIDAEMASSDAASSLAASSVREMRFSDPQRTAAFGSLAPALGATPRAEVLHVSGCVGAPELELTSRYRSGRGSAPGSNTPIAKQAWQSVSLLQVRAEHGLALPRNRTPRLGPS